MFLYHQKSLVCIQLWTNLALLVSVPAQATRADPLSSKPLYKPIEMWLETWASIPSIFTTSNWVLCSEIPYWMPSSSTWWGELHPASLNCPTLSKLPKENCKTSLLLHLYIILSWWCNVTGLALQLIGLCTGPVQLTKLANNYAQFCVHGFLPLVLSWGCELSTPRGSLLDARAGTM